MTTLPRLAAVLCTLAIAPLPLRAAEKEDSRFTKGPAKVPLKDYADVQVPAGYRFADGAMVQEMMRSSGEPVSGRELGAIFSEAAKWFVVFLFDEVGYVKDDEKNQLDADKLLKTIKSNNDAGNEYRKKNGVAPLNIIGWEKQPAYDEKSHNLEWAIRAESEGRLILNYNVRVLGRKGVMEVILVVPPEQLTITLPAFRTLLEGTAIRRIQVRRQGCPIRARRARHRCGCRGRRQARLLRLACAHVQESVETRRGGRRCHRRVHQADHFRPRTRTRAAAAGQRVGFGRRVARIVPSSDSHRAGRKFHAPSR